MNQEFDRAVSEIRDEPIADSVVEAAAQRVWARISAGAVGNAAATPHGAPPHIRDCGAFQALIPDLRANRLDDARATLLRDHLHECVTCRRVYEGRVAVMPRPGAARKATPVYRYAAAAAIVAAAGVAVWIGYNQFGHSGRAIVQSVNGSLFAVSSDGIHPLASGAALPDGVEIRTAKDSSAMLELRDGSVVEMRERSAFTTDQAPRDITLRLNRGSIIVQAAHRSSGHLFVATSDCRVAVTGTIFSVTAGAKGSRVSVVQGEVHVDEANQQKVLKPGSQMVTGPELDPEPVPDDLAWSRNHERYDTMLAAVGQAIRQIRQPNVRYDSRLLGRLPANVMFYAGIPNLAEYLGAAEDVFRKKLAESPELEGWWQSHGGQTAPLIEKLRAASEYLGDEIAVVGLADSDGPAVLTEVKRAGFESFLKQSGLPMTEMERNGLVLFGAPRTVEQLAPALDSANGAIQSTDFYRRVDDAYKHGAGFLLCVNVAQTGRSPHAPAFSNASPFVNAQTLVFNETQLNGVTENRLAVDFSGERTGIAAWLANPAPMGALDYISPEASAAAAAVVPNGAAIADQLKMVSPEELGAVRDALSNSLGGEFAIALDGPVMPVPSWKLIAEVYNPAELQSALQQAEIAYSNSPANAGHKPLATGQETFEGRTFYSIAVPDGGPLLEFHYTFTNGYLVAGPSRAVVIRALQIKDSANSLLHSSKLTAMMPRDHHADFSLLFYQDLGPALEPLQSLLGGLAPQHPGESQGRGPAAANLASLRPHLIAAYAEPERITFAANGDLLGPALAGLMRGDFMAAAGSAVPFFQQHGTHKRQMSYR